MFKDRLKELREREGLTQKELGERIYVSRSAVCKWEMGNGIPSDVNLQTLCEYFQVEEVWLLDRQDLKAAVCQYERKIRNRIDFVIGIVVPIVLLVFSTMRIYYSRCLDGVCFAVYMPPRSILYYLKGWSALPLAIWSITFVFFLLQIRPCNTERKAKIYFKIDVGLLILSVLVFIVSFIVTNAMANADNFWFFLVHS